MNVNKIGEIVYDKWGAIDPLNKTIRTLLLRQYGPIDYREKLKLFWIKKYTIHFYCLIFSLLVSTEKIVQEKVMIVFFFSFAAHFYLLENLKAIVQKRQEKLLEGFFEFSSLFTLLITAGMTNKKAMQMSIGNHEFSKILNKAYLRMSSGIPEVAAFEEISSSCREPVITRYFGCISQGQRHGNKKLKEDLVRITNENWQEKLKLHRKKGETLKTKLVFPMMIIFTGILLILLLPVIIQFQGMM